MKLILALMILSCAVGRAQTEGGNHSAATDKRAADEATGKLINAALHGDAKDVKALLEQGADANAKDNRGVDVLNFAVQRADLEMVKTLLANGADAGATNPTGMAGLHIAAYNGYWEIAKLLLAKGADVNAIGSHGSTPLDMAAFQGQTNVVGLLLDNGADMSATDDMGMTALMTTVIMKHVDFARLLLDRGAKVNARDKTGRTALNYADANNPAMVELLKKAGAIKSSARDRYSARNSNEENSKAMAPVNSDSTTSGLAQNAEAPPDASAGVLPKPPGPVYIAGTNVDHDGYVKNPDWLPPFTLTNSFGVVITNAVLTRLLPNKFVYQTPAGGGMLGLDFLPEDIKAKISYDPEAATQAAALDKEAKQRRQELLAQQRQQALLAEDNAPVAETSDVAGSIRAHAQKEWPNDYSMQKYVITKQTEAYKRVVAMRSAAGVPAQVFNDIKRDAINNWVNDYEMQEFEIKKQVTAYRTMN